MKSVIHVFYLCVFSMWSWTPVFTQILPTPQSFTTVQPKWYHFIKDDDYVPHPRFMFTEYDSYFPQIFKVRNNDVYFFGNSRVEDFYGGFLLKLNGINGDLEWKYVSNHTNAPKPELYQEILFDGDDNPILSGGQSIDDYKNPTPDIILLGATQCQYSQKTINKNNGHLIEHIYSTDTSKNPLLSISTFSLPSYFTMHNQVFYGRSEGFRKTQFYSLHSDDLGVNFGDTAYISSFLFDYIPGGIPNTQREYLKNNEFLNFHNIYFSDSSFENKGVLFKEYFTEDRNIEIEIINDNIGQYLKREPYFNVVIPMYQFEEGYVFVQNHEVRAQNGIVQPRLMVLWLDKNGEEVMYKSELSIGNHFYSISLIPLGIFDNKLYVFVNNKDSRGKDILEIDIEGNTKVVGNIINTDPSMSFSPLKLGFTSSGDLVCWAIENKFGSQPLAIGGWTSIYAFDPKDLGIPFQSGTSPNSDLNNLNLYPNPTSNEFFVSSAEPIESIQVFDPFGTLVFKETLNLSQYTISTQDWAPGIYFVQINMKGKAKSEVRKVVVVH